MTTSAGDRTVSVSGPHYDELEVGQRFSTVPTVTLTDGLAAVHQAIVGDRMALPLDRDLAGRVAGVPQGLVHPALVWDVAIGQSTTATQRVIANLFYRGLELRKAVAVGDSLTTEVEITGLRDATERPGRPRRGLALLRVTTRDQHGEPVLDFYRCALLPARPGKDLPGHSDELERSAPEQPPLRFFAKVASGWRLDAFPRRLQDSGRTLVDGRFLIEEGDVVSNAPELARLTLNIANAHHDERFGAAGRRLVYGGHTIGLAAAHIARALPDCLYIVAWRSCDHVGPVFEGDTLTSAIDVADTEDAAGVTVAELHVRVFAQRADGPEAVLDWRPVILLP